VLFSLLKVGEPAGRCRQMHALAAMGVAPFGKPRSIAGRPRLNRTFGALGRGYHGRPHLRRRRCAAAARCAYATHLNPATPHSGQKSATMCRPHAVYSDTYKAIAGRKLSRHTAFRCEMHDGHTNACMDPFEKRSWYKKMTRAIIGLCSAVHRAAAGLRASLRHHVNHFFCS